MPYAKKNSTNIYYNLSDCRLAMSALTNSNIRLWAYE